MGPLLRQPAGQNRRNLRGSRNRIGLRSEVALNQGFRANSGARSQSSGPAMRLNWVLLPREPGGASFYGVFRLDLREPATSSWPALPGWKPSPAGPGRRSVPPGFWPVRPASSPPRRGPAAGHAPEIAAGLLRPLRARRPAGRRPAYPRSGVEQPPSASADASSAAIDHSLIVRSAGIRPEIPNYLRRIAIASMRWYEPCNAKSSRGVDFARTVQTIVARND